MKMQQLTNTNGHPRTLKPRPADGVFQENLLSKFRHLQDQVRELNGLLRQEKVQSKARKNIITGLQQELRSATRQTKTQRAQKENSIHREKETKRQLERLIKINTGEMAVPGKNQIMFNKRYETKCGQGCLSEIKWQCAQWNVQISVLRTYGPNLTDTVNSALFFCQRATSWDWGETDTCIWQRETEATRFTTCTDINHFTVTQTQD